MLPLNVLELRNQLFNNEYPLRCLLYGRSGTGKSRMASTFPGKKGIIDTDSGALVYSDKWGECDIYSIPEDSVLMRESPVAWMLATEALKKLVSDQSVKVIIIDSFTTLSDACLKYVMHSTGKLGQNPSFAEWGKQMDLLREFLFKAFSSKKHVISIFHEDMEKDELEGKVWCLPLITGKLAKKIPNYHDEVYHMEPTEVGGKKTYQVLTKATRLYVAKSRLDSIIGIPDLIPADFGYLMNLIQQKKEELSNGKDTQHKT